MTNSSVVTEGIRVDVVARYVPEQSAPDEGHWFFAYQVTITNLTARVVQLLSREWVITNADGKIEVVRGQGVVGHQPTMRPNEGFEYVSGCPLDTPVGTMHGKFSLVAEDGEALEAAIAPFTLADPQVLN